MTQKSRLRQSLKNLLSGFSYRLLITFTAFAVRTVFIRCLNEDYLGINGLYSSILSMLSLAELGFGTAMAYSMYQPLAQKDHKKLRQLMQLYQKVYTIIGFVILAIGCALIPFLGYIIKNKPDIEGLIFYYLLFLGDTVLSYLFFAYRNALLQADQRSYVITNYQSIFNLIKSCIQIIVLLILRNYTVYLLSQILCTIAQNTALAIRVNRDYPVFRRREMDPLPKEDKNRIFCDVKALTLTKISHVILNSSDTIIISACAGINWVGLLSNYSMIVEALTGFLCQITGAITASLGNYFAIEDREKGYRLFCRIEFMNYWLYGFCSIALIVLLNPFITLWIGDRFTLSMPIVVALVIRFFIAGFMNTLWTFRSTLGLFTQGQWRPVAVSVLNIVLSLLLGYRWGVAGVLAATSISRVCVNLWYDPWLLHSKGFGKPVAPFFLRCLVKCGVLAVITVALVGISEIVFKYGVTLSGFLAILLLVVIVPNAVLFVVFGRSDEFCYFKSLMKDKVLTER